MGLGEWSALATAAIWATSSMIYGRIRLSAWTLNLAKNSVGCLILAVQLGIVAAYNGHGYLPVPARAWGWLGLSGLIGLLLGDTFFFRSLQILGPRRALMLTTATPLFGAALGWQAFGETFDWSRGLGIAVTLLGISLVIADQRAAAEAPGLYPGTLLAGTVFGLLGAICQAVGAAISKVGMNQCDPATATFIRLLVTIAGALAIVIATSKTRATFRQIGQRSVLQRVIPGAVLGTWLGIWLSQVAIKHSDLAIATTLMTTCPLFAIPLVRVLYKHPIHGRALLGAAIAVGGIYLVVR
jgi:uncharacterized membrane protein